LISGDEDEEEEEEEEEEEGLFKAKRVRRVCIRCNTSFALFPAAGSLCPGALLESCVCMCAPCGSEMCVCMCPTSRSAVGREGESEDGVGGGCGR